MACDHRNILRCGYFNFRSCGSDASSQKADSYDVIGDQSRPDVSGLFISDVLTCEPEIKNDFYSEVAKQK